MNKAEFGQETMIIISWFDTFTEKKCLIKHCFRSLFDIILENLESVRRNGDWN